MKNRTLLFITLFASISFLSFNFSPKTMDVLARVTLISDMNRSQRYLAAYIILKNSHQNSRDILDALTSLDNASIPNIQNFFQQYIKKIEKIQLPDTLKVKPVQH